MDEWIDLLDDKGAYTGEKALKSEAHKKGLFHPTIHIWFYTLEGKVLLQQRAKNKVTFPSLWDVSVAGHVAAGEKILDGAIREVKEEIGLAVTPEDLQQIGIFKSVQKHRDDLVDCEFHHTFVSLLKHSLQELKKQEEEVADLQLVPLETLEAALTNNTAQSQYVPHDAFYYKKVIREIKERL